MHTYGRQKRPVKKNNDTSQCSPALDGAFWYMRGVGATNAAVEDSVGGGSVVAASTSAAIPAKLLC